MIQVLIPKNDSGQPKTKIALPDNQDLRNVHVLGIETFVSYNIPKSPISSVNVIPIDLMKVIFVTLEEYSSKRSTQKTPLLTFNNLFTIPGGVASMWESFPKIYNRQKFNWPNCFIEIVDTSLISTTEDQAVLLEIHYEEAESVEKEDKKANFRNRK